MFAVGRLVGHHRLVAPAPSWEHWLIGAVLIGLVIVLVRRRRQKITQAVNNRNELVAEIGSLEARLQASNEANAELRSLLISAVSVSQSTQVAVGSGVPSGDGWNGRRDVYEHAAELLGRVGDGVDSARERVPLGGAPGGSNGGLRPVLARRVRGGQVGDTEYSGDAVHQPGPSGAGDDYGGGVGPRDGGDWPLPAG